MHKAYPFENVSWIDSPFLTNSRHTKAYKIGIGSEKKAVDLACSIGFTIEKQRWLKRIRKNRTRKKDAFETRDFVESCIDCISKFYWKCTLRLFDSPIENATLVYSLNVGNELEACIIYLRVSMSRNCCHRNESIYLYEEWLWNCIEPES